jgi:hypothetical protein
MQYQPQTPLPYKLLFYTQIQTEKEESEFITS